MERSTIFKNGKPSISITAIEIPWRTVSHNQAGYVLHSIPLIIGTWSHPRDTIQWVVTPASALPERRWWRRATTAWWISPWTCTVPGQFRPHFVAIPWPLHRSLLVVGRWERSLRGFFFDAKNDCWGFLVPVKGDQAMTHSFQPLSSPWRSILL